VPKLDNRRYNTGPIWVFFIYFLFPREIIPSPVCSFFCVFKRLFLGIRTYHYHKNRFVFIIAHFDSEIPTDFWEITGFATEHIETIGIVKQETIGVFDGVRGGDFVSLGGSGFFDGGVIVGTECKGGDFFGRGNVFEFDACWVDKSGVRETKRFCFSIHFSYKLFAIQASGTRNGVGGVICRTDEHGVKKIVDGV